MSDREGNEFSVPPVPNKEQDKTNKENSSLKMRNKLEVIKMRQDNDDSTENIKRYKTLYNLQNNVDDKIYFSNIISVNTNSPIRGV